MDVDAALDRSRQAAMGQVEQLLARQDAAGILAQGQQQVEFRAGRRDLGAVRADEAALGGIKPPAREADRAEAIAGEGCARGATKPWRGRSIRAS